MAVLKKIGSVEFLVHDDNNKGKISYRLSPKFSGAMKRFHCDHLGSKFEVRTDRSVGDMLCAKSKHGTLSKCSQPKCKPLYFSRRLGSSSTGQCTFVCVCFSEQGCQRLLILP